MDSKTALIFGASGQDGAYLSEFLDRKGYKVHGTTRRRPDETFENLGRLKIRDRVELHTVDPLDCDAIDDIIDRANPDECYLLWGLTSVSASFARPHECFQSIALSTINVLEALRLRGSTARLFNAGSSECFGPTDVPAAAETPFRPVSPYGFAKASAIWAVRTYRNAFNLWACSGIMFNHESPLRDSRFVTGKIISAALQIASGSSQKLRLGNLDITRDWGWAPEFVEAFWLMLQQEKPQDYIVATGQTNPLSNFVETVFSELGLNWKDHVEIDPSLIRPMEITQSMADVTALNRDLGWRANVLMDEVAKRMIAAQSALDDDHGGR